MYKKAILFNDQTIAQQILNTNDPRKIKSFGRKVQNFDDNIWRNQCCNIVTTGCLLKFSQNHELKDILLSTNDSYLAEASPYDRIWGTGLNAYNTHNTPRNKWSGTNWLGHCLMDVRSELRR